ncbi:caffeoylshikimate esterase isoform X1 [Ipomoea triloba]|uniref:caffeoylshikimate esterase isoform X1 n=1 Tax=Ipomoea triloba TaxID=35885 RepID=UPI00125E4D94|nr:caffeoylshikimate esterase isoform X1 [Ipomoea triloba]
MAFEYQEGYIRNSRGVQLFTCRWLPFSSPKALVFLCHGYGMECSDFMRDVGIKLASHGYAVYGIDYEGHGRSMGARCYIESFDNIVKDCSLYFKSVCAQEEYREKRRFLYGESMGGAVALLIHKMDPSFWHGAILVAPMCKISEKVKPHPLVISLLTKVEDVIPKWKIVPTKDIIDSAFKDPVKREEIRGNKLIYQKKPRLKTALEMLRTSMNLEESLWKVSITILLKFYDAQKLPGITLPFFVLHGEADTVTDPEVSKALYKQASSKDKTIKLYPGMWHGLTSGEPDDNIEIVFSDIISWLDKRSSNETDATSQSQVIPVPASGMIPRRTTSHTSYFCRRAQFHSAM